MNKELIEFQVAFIQKLNGRGLSIEEIAKAVEISEKEVKKALKQEIS